MKPYSRIQAKTKRILIRPYLMSDFPTCQKAHACRLPLQNKFDNETNTSALTDRSEFKHHINTLKRHGKMGVHFVFGIFHRKTGEHLGQTGVFLINKQLSWANLGYQIHNHHWGNGYASEACSLALQVGFRELNFHRIEAATTYDNKASIKVAKNIGMIREGVRKKFFPDDGGVDMIVFAANAIDFKLQKNRR